MTTKSAKKPALPPLPADLDPVLVKAIEDAMRPYLGVLPASGLATMQDILIDALTTHPVAVEALAELKEQDPTGASGTRVRREDEGKEEP
jgi:hypothetical protein